MKKHITIPILTCLSILAYAETAYAWGPVTHIGLGEFALGQLAALPAGIAAILNRHRIAYLFGNIAADIVFAKKLSRVKQFCHHWSTGFGLLESAANDRDKAFAYGYLAHLAADTVAHNKFVPYQILKSRSSINFGHLYWELRADALANPDLPSRLREVLAHNHDSHHRNLRSRIKGTFLPYNMNRALFHRLSKMGLSDNVHRTIGMWERHPRWILPQTVLKGYVGEASDRIISLLTQGSRSAITKEDPNGTSTLMQITVGKRNLRRLQRQGVRTHQHINETSATLLPAKNLEHP